MNVSPVNSQPQVKKNSKKNSKLNAAKDGAVITSAVLSASTGISWITKKSEMQNVVEQYGGKGKYAANLAMGIALLSAAGALANTVLYTAMNKIASGKNSNKNLKAAKNPKAAN